MTMRKAMLLVGALLIAAPAAAQTGPCATQICTIPVHFLSAATTNPTNIKPAPGALYSVIAHNTTTTTAYLKFIDKATAPTCGTDPVVQTIPISGTVASTDTIPLAIPYTFGVNFNAGISFCITGLQADNDTTAVGTGITVSLTYR
jgi:hypothetical protein